jgi:hypothetical protein
MSDDPYVRVGAPPAASPKRSNRRRVLVLVLIAVATLGGAAGIGGGILFAMVQAGKVDNPLSRSFTVEGTITLDHGDFVTTDDSCFGDGGYNDMHLGTQVVVTDAAQKTVAVGKIVAAEDTVTECRLTFRVEDVPRGEDFYGIEVSHRGRLQYTADDLEQPLTLSLG